VTSILRLWLTEAGRGASELVDDDNTFFSLDRMIFCCAISRTGALLNFLK
jgi:hypothetical protein